MKNTFYLLVEEVSIPASSKMRIVIHRNKVDYPTNAEMGRNLVACSELDKFTKIPKEKWHEGNAMFFIFNSLESAKFGLRRYRANVKARFPMMKNKGYSLKEVESTEERFKVMGSGTIRGKETDTFIFAVKIMKLYSSEFVPMLVKAKMTSVMLGGSRVERTAEVPSLYELMTRSIRKRPFWTIPPDDWT